MLSTPVSLDLHLILRRDLAHFVLDPQIATKLLWEVKKQEKDQGQLIRTNPFPDIPTIPSFPR